MTIREYYAYHFEQGIRRSNPNITSDQVKKFVAESLANKFDGKKTRIITTIYIPINYKPYI